MQNTQLNFNSDFYKVEVGIHKEMKILWVKFPKDFSKIAMLKSVTKPRFSRSQKCWYIADNNYNRSLFGLEPKIIGKDALQKISKVNLPAMQRYQEQLILKGFSNNTIRTYCIEFAQLLYLIKDYPVENLTAEKLRSYILYCHNQLQLSENQIHSRMNALKFYYEKVLSRTKLFLDIPRPKKPQQLPKALNQKEIKKIIDVTENPKHRLVIQLAYGMGLRVSEIVNLKLEHIDSKNMTVFIEKAKGKKDRIAQLPETVLQDMKTYYKAYKPEIWLFEGQFGGQYTVRSAQNVFKNAMKKAKINRTVGIHSLRHSYATHLLEYGTDITLIQKLLGHTQISTTLNYTKVVDKDLRRVESPLDKL